MWWNPLWRQLAGLVSLGRRSQGLVWGEEGGTEGGEGGDDAQRRGLNYLGTSFARHTRISETGGDSRGRDGGVGQGREGAGEGSKKNERIRGVRRSWQRKDGGLPLRL